jgi:hypothetical protein
VKCPHWYVVSRPEQLLDAGLHFCGSATGKGECEKSLGRNLVVLDAMSNAMTDDSRLAAARAREDKNWAAAKCDGPLLLGVEMIE